MNETKQRLKLSEVEIRIKDILIECMRSVKLVLILTVLCAAIFIGIGVISSKNASNTNTTNPDALNNYEEVYQTLQQAQINAVNNAVSMANQIQFLLDYTSESDKMNIEYYQEPITVLEIYLDVDDKDSESDILYLYQNYIAKGGLAEAITLETEETRYIRELITTYDSVNVGNSDFPAYLCIQVIASTEEKRDDLVQRVKTQLGKYGETISEVVGSHKLVYTNETSSVIIDETTKTYQDTHKQMLTDLQTKLANVKVPFTNAQLYVYNYLLGIENNNSATPAPASQEISYSKYIVLGSALGVVLAIFIIIVRFIFDKTIKNSFEVQKMYGVRNLGLLYKSPKCKYAQFVDKFAYGKGLDNSFSLLKANLGNVTEANGNDEIAVIGDYSDNELADLLKSFDDKKTKIVSVGNVLRESESVLEIPKYKNAIMVMKERGISYAELYQMLVLCEQEEVNVLGYITIV